MAAPARQSEDTVIADGTTLSASAETTFDYDVSAAFYARITLNVTFPASGQGNIDVYQCISESSNTSDYPNRAQGIFLGTILATASASVVQSLEAYQGLSRFRLYNNGTSAATSTRARARKYI